MISGIEIFWDGMYSVIGFEGERQKHKGFQIMTMNTLTFRELVKMIHPDINPDIEDAGAKMSQATRHRENPSFLFRLAVQWGLIGGRESTSSENTQSSYGDTTSNNFWFVVGNVVVYYARSRRGRIPTRYNRAVIVDVVNGKGKRKGWKKILAVNLVTRKIIYFFIPSVESSRGDGIEVVGKANLDKFEKSKVIYNDYIDSLTRRNEIKKEMKQKREEKVKESLSPNMGYQSLNVWIISKTIKGMVKVTRTTAKRVYYWDTWQEKERYVQMASVINVIDKDKE
jgi:hypothetical protein